MLNSVRRLTTTKRSLICSAQPRRHSELTTSWLIRRRLHHRRGKQGNRVRGEQVRTSLFPLFLFATSPVPLPSFSVRHLPCYPVPPFSVRHFPVPSFSVRHFPCYPVPSFSVRHFPCYPVPPSPRPFLFPFSPFTFKLNTP